MIILFKNVLPRPILFDAGSYSSQQKGHSTHTLITNEQHQ